MFAGLLLTNTSFLMAWFCFIIYYLLYALLL